MSFSHLHVHTTYSFLDGASRVDHMVEGARDRGFPALAITDHGFLHGWPEFQVTCQEAGIKPILGVEAYLLEDLQAVYRAKESKDVDVRKAATKQLMSPCHQLLLAMNDEGVRSITNLISYAAAHQTHYRKPIIDLAQLEAHSEGVIATSSCMSGIIPRAIQAGDEQEAERLIHWFQRVFGDRFYFEVHNHGIEEEDITRDAIERLAPKHGIPVICANDVHYVDRDDFEAQKVLVAISMNKKLSDVEYAHENLHLATEAEMATLFHKQFPSSLEETMRLGERCTGSLPFGRDYVLPKITAPAGFADAFAYVSHLCVEAIPKRYPGDQEPARQRLSYELSMLRQMQADRGVDFPSYFLITSGMTNFARERGIWVGPGRGSAAGSIVSYLLGITNIDPLRFDLLFERFINPERVSMPDIDTDFQDSRREEVVQYLRDTYGDESVMRIVTFTKMGSKGAVRDVSRIMGIPIAESDRLSSKVPDRQGEKEFAHEFIDDPYVVGKSDKNKRVRAMVEMAPRVFGLARQTGLHPCGVVVTPGVVTDYLPTCGVKPRGAKSAVPATQFEGSFIESMGLLKLDVLGLKTGTIIQETIDLVKRTRGIEIDIDNLPLDDSATYAMYCRGDTDATFQFESGGMREWMVQLQPHTIDDLVALVALYRPGPMKLIPKYIRRKNGEERVEYPHPSLSEVLGTTYGIAVYQEQVMKMAQVLAGFSLGQADILRKAMGKKKIAVMQKMKPMFIEGCADVQGIGAYQAEQLYKSIESFAEYGFNRSHAAAYAMMAYQTGYLKANYPVEYMTTVVSNNASNMKEKTKYLQTCRSMGITVLPPQINESQAGFYADPDQNLVFYGLGTIRGVGDAASSVIIADREAGGPFKSLRDFIERVALNPDNRISSGDIGALIRVGAFDKMGERNALLWEMDQLMPWARKVRDYERGSISKTTRGMWGSHRKSLPDVPSIDPLNSPREMSFEEKLRFEMQYLGQFISGHPMEGFESVNGMIQQITGARPNIKEPETFAVGYKSCTSYVGYVISTEEKRIKNGKNKGDTFLIVTLLAGDETVEMIAWPDTYERYAALLVPDERLWVVATRRGASSVIDAAIDLREVLSDWGQGIRLRLNGTPVEDVLDAIGYAPGKQWMIIEREGETLIGPEITLSPIRLRKLSQLGDVTVL